MESHNSQTIQAPREIRGLMDALCRSDDVRLQLESEHHSYPVTLKRAEQQRLQLDLTASPEVVAHLERGDRFTLVGQGEGALVQTALLHATQTDGARFELDYPDSLSTVRRRDTFRAPLQHDMRVDAEIDTAKGEYVVGQLENLSIGGCRIELPLIAAAQLADQDEPVRLTVRFPSGDQFRAQIDIRHLGRDTHWTMAHAGCEFTDHGVDFGRNAAYFVREIERHAARRADRYDSWLTPSGLFTDDPSERSRTVLPPDAELTATAVFLNEQIAAMASGHHIAVDQLLIYSQALLNQLRRNRSALLFSLTALADQSLLIRHCISVAVYLADVLPDDYAVEQRRAIVACALIHDLGKASLPQDLLQSKTALSAEQRAVMQNHVADLTAQLPHTSLLPQPIVNSVIVQANERLDGSGYPNQSRGDQLPHLARMMAVVDVADAMSRPRADRAPHDVEQTYAHLLSRADLFDNRCAQRYIRRFGKIPVGSLARYSSGILAWIQQLDESGTPNQIQLALRLRAARNIRLNKIVRDDDIPAIGQIEALVEPRDYDL